MFITSYFPNSAIRFKACLQALLASFFIGACAQIEIVLPLNPVPFTIQTTGIVLTSLLLGPRAAVMSVLLYLFHGSIGLPMWAGGASGCTHLFGPTGGYLWGYIPQALFISYFSKNTSKGFLFPILLIAICLQLSLGSLWLAQFVSFKQCFSLGFAPFFLTEVMKALILLFSIGVRNANFDSISNRYENGV